MSSVDIDPGARWSVNLANKLEEIKFGIICLTRESTTSSWLLFEAGALAKTLSKTFVCPYLIDCDIADLQEPLSQFNAVRANKRGTFKLIRCINRALGDGALPDDILRKTFDRWWPDLERDLNQMPPGASQPEASTLSMEKLGLQYAFQTRGEALGEFGKSLESEIEKGRRKLKAFVYLTGATIRGFLVPAGSNFDGRRILEDIVGSRCEFRALLTEPSIADHRCEQEGREAGSIGRDVRESVLQLKNIGVKRRSIRYSRGSPTVFGIATGELMLLNPYPYARESHRCFSLLVRKTDQPDDVYHQ